MDSLKDQQLMRKSGQVVEANQVLEDKKIICYYFSAHWCPPCRNFTPRLKQIYESYKAEAGENAQNAFS